MTKLDEIPVSWDAASEGDILEPGAVSYVRFLGQKLFDDYEPLQFQSFDTQLLDWLNNVDEIEDKKTLFALLGDLFYIGRREYASLYRSAYNGAISSWIIDVCNLDLFANDIDNQIRDRMNQSWICPMTDSLRINAFLKTNDLVSQSVRPDWLSLLEFAEIGKLHSYINKKKIRNLIILEDFVGSGVQASDILKFIGKNFPELNVLFSPLVVCPRGDTKLNELTEKFSQVRYAPQLVLPEISVMSPEPKQGEPRSLAAARALFEKISKRFILPQYETMYGFKSTGSQVVLYSNCPNNTLQIYHHKSDGWNPLFPRVRRVL